MIALPDSTKAICPSCKGSGQRQVKGSRRTRLMTCLSCFGAGLVEADRVCSGCGRWIAGCVCFVTVGRELCTLPREKKHTLLVARLLCGQWVVRKHESTFYSREISRFDNEAAARTFADKAQYVDESAWSMLADRCKEGVRK